MIMKIRLENQEKITEDRKAIGERIAKYRKQKGLTQEQLSELCGVNRANICKIERGAYNVSFDILAKLAGAMGFDIDLKVSSKVKPLHWRDRERIELVEGKTYYLSFGGHKVVPCTFLRYMEEYRGERILVEVERGRGLCQHILFPDEIGRTPEEAVMREVTM